MSEQTYDYSGLIEILQSQEKPPASLRKLKQSFRNVCSAALSRNKNNVYMKALKQATKPYLTGESPLPNLQPMSSSDVRSLTPSKDLFKESSSKAAPPEARSSEEITPEKASLGATSQTTDETLPFEPISMEEWKLLMPDSPAMNVELPELPVTENESRVLISYDHKSLNPIYTIMNPDSQDDITQAENLRIKARILSKDSRKKHQQEKSSLETLVCRLNPGLVLKEIKAGITITPHYEKPEFFNKYMRSCHRKNDQLLKITKPENLPQKIHQKFKNACSAEDSRQREKLYMEMLNQLVDNPQQSGATPMKTSVDDIQAQVMSDDRSIKQWIINGEGYFINDSLPYVTYMIDPQIRRELISDSLREHLRLPQKWDIGYFRFNKEDENPQALAHAMQNATDKNALDNSGYFGAFWLSDTDQSVSDLLNLQLEKTTTQNPELSLTPKGMMVGNGTLAIFNASTEKSLIVKRGNSKTSRLAPKEGIFLQPGSTQAQIWSTIGFYRIGEKSLDTNPLLRDNCPLMTKGRYSKIDDSDTQGEYFLPAVILEDLAARQSKKAGRPAPALCMSDSALKNELKKFRQSPETSCSLITGSDKANHFVAARLIKSEGRILVYIHETLGQDNPVSCNVQQMLLKVVHEQFAGSNIYFLTPEPVLQKDFSSCGISALKALRAFDKRPELDQWLLDEVSKRPESKSEQPAEEGDCAISPESRISLQEIRPELLKIYQGAIDQLTEQQRQTMVSHKSQNFSCSQPCI